MNREGRRHGNGHPTVVLGYLHPGDVSAAFMASVTRCRDYELVRTNMLFGQLGRRAKASQIGAERNHVTAAFLQSPAEWLWFVDADMGFPKTALQQLLATADSEQRPIVGGLCFAQRGVGFDDDTNAERFEISPTLYIHNGGEPLTFTTVTDYPRGQAVRVHSTGAACVLIHRTVFERMEVKFGNSWWTHITDGGRQYPEDTSFFLRAHDLDIPVWVNTAVRTSHDKGGIFLTEEAWDLQNRPRS